MAVKDKDTLYNYFKRGSIPSQDNYESLIDSCYIEPLDASVEITRVGSSTKIKVNKDGLGVSPSNAEINFKDSGGNPIGSFTLNQSGGKTITIPTKDDSGDSGCDGQLILKSDKTTIKPPPAGQTYYACSGKNNTIVLSDVAFSGKYSDLDGVPVIPDFDDPTFKKTQSDYTEPNPLADSYIKNKPDYSSGVLKLLQNGQPVESYVDDGSNLAFPFKADAIKPIRYEILPPDWDAPENSKQGIVNKPLLAEVAFTGDYFSLKNRGNVVFNNGFDVEVNETTNVGIGQVVTNSEGKQCIGIDVILKALATVQKRNPDITFTYSSTGDLTLSFDVVNNIIGDGKGRIPEYFNTKYTLNLNPIKDEIERLKMIGGRWLGQNFLSLAELLAVNITNTFPNIIVNDYVYVRDETHKDSFGNPQMCLYRWFGGAWVFSHIIQEDPVGQFTNSAFGYIIGDSCRPGYVNADEDGYGFVNCLPKVLDYDNDTKTIWLDCKLNDDCSPKYCVFGFNKGVVSDALKLNLVSYDVFSYKYVETTTNILDNPTWTKFFVYPCESCSKPIITSSQIPIILNMNNSAKVITSGSTVSAWTITGTLPPGITFDTNTGTFFGIPTAMGNKSVVIRASNSCGYDEKTVLLIIEDVGISSDDRDWFVTFRWTCGGKVDYDFSFVSTEPPTPIEIYHNHSSSSGIKFGTTTNFISCDRDDQFGYNISGITSWNPLSTWGETYSIKGNNFLFTVPQNSANFSNLNRIALSLQGGGSSTGLYPQWNHTVFYDNSLVLEMRIFRNIGSNMVELYKTVYWTYANSPSLIPSIIFKSGGGFLPDNIFTLNNPNASVYLSPIRLSSNFGSDNPDVSTALSIGKMVEFDLTKVGVQQLVFVRQ